MNNLHQCLPIIREIGMLLKMTILKHISIQILIISLSIKDTFQIIIILFSKRKDSNMM